MTPPTPRIPNQLHAVLLDPESLAQVMTPALAIYPDFIDANIEATLRLLQADVNRGDVNHGDVDRWQPHVKTAKLASTMQRLCAHGVRRFKCATTLEMLTACQAGAEEVLMSYPSDGLRAKRVRQIAAAYPKTLIAATVENPEQVAQWSGSRFPCISISILA